MIHILLPTDFSKNSQNAIDYALNLYKKENCIFYFLNTYTPTIYSYDYQMRTSGYTGEMIDIIKNNSIKQLEFIAANVAKKYNNPNHKFELISSFNLLTDEIKDAIDKYKIDLIIMGTKGATGADEILFGTNTVHIIQKVKCPVLAIPNDYTFTKPREILFPTDYIINYSVKQLQPLNKIAKLHDSKIQILNVSHGFDLTEVQNRNKEVLSKLLKNANFSFHRVNDQTVSRAINTFQETNNIDLLMMVNNKHSFFENLFFRPVINQIGFHLHIPFLVIPAKN